MWNYFLSVDFMQYKDINGMLDNNKLLDFLNKTILFIWTYAITNPGVNALRTPIFNEMSQKVSFMKNTINFIFPRIYDLKQKERMREINEKNKND